ncbi:MAG TPA: SAM-dependent methyltransferase [Devosia sp.]|nr:SAM-dependent methyltransferase [Devosia sp.]
MADSSLTLGEQIDAQIRATGPMSIATYMGLCLSHPRHGYYAAGRPIGAQGDFITAPEVSQMFGELIGFFVVNLWQQMGEPKSITLLELGPGRGTLMQDALRAASRAEGFENALHLQLYETNHLLKGEQEKRLGRYSPYWASEIDAVSEDPLFVVANEFFDALPIRQYVRTDDGWHERLVGLRDGVRAFGLSPTPIAESAAPPEVRGAHSGEVLELSAAAAETMQRLARKVAVQGGAILAIDYGYPETQTGETLQAVKAHAFADPLDAPGETDISAHVNFGVLGQAARAAGLAVAPLARQGDWLLKLGLGERAKVLARANPGEAANIARAVERLTSPAQMGTLFKAFCAHSPGLRPAGF